MARLLTVRQPWANLIMQGVKDIENRTWATEYRGEIYIHAGRAGVSPADLALAESHLGELPDLPFGVVLGSVNLVDIVRDHPSPWAIPGTFHWVLSPGRFLLRKPVPWRGNQGLLPISPALGERLIAVQDA